MLIHQLVTYWAQLCHLYGPRKDGLGKEKERERERERIKYFKICQCAHARGWSFLVPGFVMILVGILLFFFLVIGK